MTQLGATRRRRDVQLTVGRSIEGNQPVRGETWQPSQLKLISHEIREKGEGSRRRQEQRLVALEGATPLC